MKTERIELDGGAWWEIRTVLTVGMAKASEEVSLKYLKPKNLEAVAQGNGGTLEYDFNLQDVNLFEVTRVLVFAATMAWSYGPVTKQVFENEVPQADYMKVAGRCNELFGSLPLAEAIGKD